MREDHLVKEMEWFTEHRQELLAKYRGKWVVIYDRKLIGVYDDFASAYQYGINTTKSPKLLVTQVLEKDEPIEISVNFTYGLLYENLST